MSTSQSSPAVAEPVLRLVAATTSDDKLSTEQLGARIVGLAGRLAAATCRWLLLVADFDRREGCAKWGLGTTAAWLMHTCALSRRTAFEHVRVARALAAQPTLVTAMASGTLSYSQVRAITRVVRPGDAATVADLTQAAQHCSIGQLETVVRGLRTCEKGDEPTPDEEDYVRSGWTSGSRWRITSSLAPEQGALVESVMATLARTEGLARPQALVRMAELALAAVNDSENLPRPLRGDEDAAIVVHVNAADIPFQRANIPDGRADNPVDIPVGTADAAAGETERPAAEAPLEAADTPAEATDQPDRPECSAEHREPRAADRWAPAGRLADGPGLRWAVIEQLLCHGRIRTAVHDGDGNIQHLGRSHRTVPHRLFRALLHRDAGHCTYPGCTSRGRLQAHHVRHWLWGGLTALPNLVLLCERHHHSHHDGDFSIEPRGRTGFRFLRSDGVDLSVLPERSELAAAAPDVDEVHDAIAHDAATPRWDGTRMDRNFAVSCLAEGRERERERAGTHGRSGDRRATSDRRRTG